MFISVEPGRFGTYIIEADDGRTVLIQSDWDFPGVASSFGWSPAALATDCDHDGTDGTVDCPSCPMRAITFINDAASFLDDGPDPVEDPGYFTDDE